MPLPTIDPQDANNPLYAKSMQHHFALAQSPHYATNPAVCNEHEWKKTGHNSWILREKQHTRPRPGDPQPRDAIICFVGCVSVSNHNLSLVTNCKLAFPDPPQSCKYIASIIRADANPILGPVFDAAKANIAEIENQLCANANSLWEEDGGLRVSLNFFSKHDTPNPYTVRGANWPTPQAYQARFAEVLKTHNICEVIAFDLDGTTRIPPSEITSKLRPGALVEVSINLVAFKFPAKDNNPVKWSMNGKTPVFTTQRWWLNGFSARIAQFMLMAAAPAIQPSRIQRHVPYRPGRQLNAPATPAAPGGGGMTYGPSPTHADKSPLQYSTQTQSRDPSMAPPPINMHMRPRFQAEIHTPKVQATPFTPPKTPDRGSWAQQLSRYDGGRDNEGLPSTLGMYATAGLGGRVIPQPPFFFDQPVAPEGMTVFSHIGAHHAGTATHLELDRGQGLASPFASPPKPSNAAAFNTTPDGHQGTVLPSTPSRHIQTPLGSSSNGPALHDVHHGRHAAYPVGSRLTAPNDTVLETSGFHMNHGANARHEQSYESGPPRIPKATWPTTPAQGYHIPEKNGYRLAPASVEHDLRVQVANTYYSMGPSSDLVSQSRAPNEVHAPEIPGENGYYAGASVAEFDRESRTPLPAHESQIPGVNGYYAGAAPVEYLTQVGTARTGTGRASEMSGSNGHYTGQSSTDTLRRSLLLRQSNASVINGGGLSHQSPESRPSMSHEVGVNAHVSHKGGPHERVQNTEVPSTPAREHLTVQDNMAQSRAPTPLVRQPMPVARPRATTPFPRQSTPVDAVGRHATNLPVSTMSDVTTQGPQLNGNGLQVTDPTLAAGHLFNENMTSALTDAANVMLSDTSAPTPYTAAPTPYDNNEDDHCENDNGGQIGTGYSGLDTYVERLETWGYSTASESGPDDVLEVYSRRRAAVLNGKRKENFEDDADVSRKTRRLAFPDSPDESSAVGVAVA
ncbi:hypothetical protein B0H11DRAFT_1936250 [Mycena galericulata]|nr:hypothetical protein B0H11DRAFT_1936250 [Mycena galericulata]